MRVFRSVIVAVAALAVLGTACSDDDGNGSTASSTTTTSSSSTTTTTTTTTTVPQTAPPTAPPTVPPTAAPNQAQAVIDAARAWAFALPGLGLQPDDISVRPPTFSTVDPSWALTGVGPSGPGVQFQGGQLLAHDVGGTWQIIELSSGDPGYACTVAPPAVVTELSGLSGGGIDPC
jgi:hypothetical protein